MTPAGRLPIALSDAGAAALGSQILLAGGREPDGTVSDQLYTLRQRHGEAAPATPRALALVVVLLCAGALSLAAFGDVDRPRDDDVRWPVCAARRKAGVRPPLAGHLADEDRAAPVDPNNVYAADGKNDLSPVVRGFRPLIYVPNSASNTVEEIDPSTYRVVAPFRRRRASAARRPLVRPAHAVGDERRRATA